MFAAQTRGDRGVSKGWLYEIHADASIQIVIFEGLKTKKDHIDYWVAQSEEDWEVAMLLIKEGKNLHGLFFVHLALEKICKAHWIRSSKTHIPPRTHNLIFILSQTDVLISNEQKQFLLEINRFQIEGRYPEQLAQLHGLVINNAIFTQEIVFKAKELRIWLLSRLP
jgi:HEPN domain-containing protein